VLSHTKGEGLERSKDEPAVERGGDCSVGVLGESELREEGRAGSDDEAEDDV
jgi:hypothetical protein